MGSIRAKASDRRFGSFLGGVRGEFDSVSFHPYQDLKEFELCHNESKKVTRQQNKDAAESWTAAGGDDGVQTGAHHGAYEKNGLKTVKKPARAV